MNSCTLRWPRFNDKSSANQPQPFPYAYQADAGLSFHQIKIESCSKVRHTQIDSFAVIPKLDDGFRGTAVFHDVSQGLLRDSEDAERNLIGNSILNRIMNKLDLQAVLL